MTKQEEEVGTALRDLLVKTVNEAQHGDLGELFAGTARPCEVFADADGNVWARAKNGDLLGRVQLVVSPCPA